MSLARLFSVVGVGIGFAAAGALAGAVAALAWLWLWLPGHPWVVLFAPLGVCALAGLVLGSWWKSGLAREAFVATTNALRRYLAILAVGLGAAACVIVVGAYLGVGPRVDEGFVMKAADVPGGPGYRCDLVTALILPPWYVMTSASVMLIAASGWQWRRGN